MPYIILFSLSWAAFFLFADRSRWRSFLPACMLSVVMSLTSDVLVTHVPLWNYYDLSHRPIQLPLNLLDDFGIYPVTTYLFLQHYPPVSSRLKKFRYYIYWTTYAISLELLFCSMGWMVHSRFWSLGCSYLADWLIFLVLLRFFLLSGRAAASRTVPGLHLDFLHERRDLEVVMLTASPGSVVPRHQHSTDELIVLLSGAMDIQTDGGRQPLHLQTPLLIPRGVRHSAFACGKESAVLLSILMPASLRKRLEQYSDEMIFAGETLEL